MVIGPTPPGTGVIAAATPCASAKATSPTIRDLPPGTSMRLCRHRSPPRPASPNRRAPARPSQRRPPGRPLRADRRQIRGSSNGRASRCRARQQQRGHRLADEIGPADDHGAAPVKSGHAARSSRMHPHGVHGTSARPPSASLPAFSSESRRRPSPGRWRRGRAADHCGGKGSCTRMPSTRSSAIELCDQRQQLGLAARRRQLFLETREAGLDARLGLAADIDLAGGIVAHQHGAKTRHDAARGF